MDNTKFKRILFYWIDLLEISRRERITLAVTSLLIIVVVISTNIVSERKVVVPENHAAILEEFERRSALIAKEDQEQLAKYEGIELDPQLENSVPVKEVNAEPQVQTMETATEILMININKADITQLKKLPGIGEAYAQRIIEYRQNNGDFKSVEQLTEVKGIGPKTLEKLRPFIEL